jgi:PAS domain S-box-containing protein
MDFPQFFSILFHKLALFITLAILQGTLDLAARRYPAVMRWQRVLVGLLFGLFATVDMLSPVHLSDGVILDTRNIIILVVVATNGRLTGLIVTLIICVMRMGLGGTGALPGVGAALTAFALGLVVLRQRRLSLSNPVVSLGLGGVLALLNLFWFSRLPASIASQVLSVAAAPICIFYPLGTYIMHTALSYGKDYVQLQFMLNHERTMLRTLIDNLPDYIHVRDANEKFLLANQAYADAAGLKPDAILGKTLEDIFPSQAGPHDALDHQTVMQGDAIIGQMREIQMPGVGPLWMSITRIPLRDVDGHVTGVIGINHDMSESRRAAVALAKSETRHRSVVQNLVEGVVLQNTKGEIETCNPQAEAILGLTKEQMMGKSSLDPEWHAVHEDLTPFPGEMHPAIVSLRTGQRQNNVVMGVYKPNNTLTWILINTEPLFALNDPQPYAVVASFLDITERKSAEEQSLRLAAEQHRTDALQKFIRNISHDLRTPLSILDLNVQMLQRTHKEEKSQHRFDVMQEQVLRIAHLLETFIDVVQYDNAGGLEHTRPVEMNTVVSHARSVYQELADKKDQTLTIQQTCAALYVLGDEKQLQQAVDSLLQNAITYTLEQGTITVSLVTQEDYLVITVADNGIGISAEDLPHIFERFYRADSARSTLTGGSGLGLTLVQQIATNHKGHVEVESQIGQGSTFRLLLPLAQDPALMALGESRP